MKKVIATILILTMVLGVFASCGNDVNTEKKKETKEATDGNEYEVSKADIFEKGNGILGWWDNWARFSEGTVEYIQSINADTGFTGSRNDEGRGPYSRKVDSLSGKTTLDLLHNAGLRAGAWIECQGDSRTFLMALHQLEDGSFEIDRRTGAAKMYSFVWGWTSTGPLANEKANYLCWSGVHSFVNNEEWAYPYVLSEYPEIDVPTYPDGTPAVGYLDGGDISTPHLAKIYDACSAKDINGSVIRFDELGLTSGDTTYALELVDRFGKKYFTDDFSFGKDTAAPFWLQYEKNSIEFWMEQGVDFFWIDNWNGWDNINNTPLKKAFGNWSEYKFREYLKEHPELGVKDTENFSISEYVIKKAKKIDPNCTTDNFGDIAWTSKEWTQDKIWLAYLAFKAKTNRAFNSAVYDTIKEKSEEMYGDRYAVAGTVNDFPYMTFAAFDCDKIDMISTEYGTNYSAATGFVTSGVLPNRYSGHCYSLLTASTTGHNATVWYYATKYPYTDLSGKVYGYEALAYNCILHSTFSGTDASNEAVYGTIGDLKETLSDRRLYSEIGIMYSPDSETCELAPGGFVNWENNAHDISYMGWCQAMDELNIPYKSIQYQKLDEKIQNCEMLILPNVLSIDEATIKNVIIPWLDDGGTLIITGQDAGKWDSMENNYTPRKSSLLVKMLKDRKCKNGGKVIYFEEDPCFNYFKDNKSKTIGQMYEAYLINIKQYFDEWVEKGYIHDTFKINISVGTSMITTLNYSQEEERFFIDIVNLQYNHNTDELKEVPENLECTVRIPSNYWQCDKIKVTAYSDVTGEITTLTEGTDYTIDGIYMTINVPDFQIYETIMLENG